MNNYKSNDGPVIPPLVENRQSECSECEYNQCNLKQKRICEHKENVQPELKGGNDHGDIIYLTDNEELTDLSDAGSIRYISDDSDFDDEISIESYDSQESREPSYRGYSTESDSYGYIGSDTGSETDEEEIEELIHSLDDDIKLSDKDSESTDSKYEDLYEVYEENNTNDNLDEDSETDSEGERIKAILDELELSESEPDELVLEDNDDIIEIDIHNEYNEPDPVSEDEYRTEIKGGLDEILKKFQYVGGCC